MKTTLKKTAGYTLIELLIGMGLTLVVMGASLVLFRKSVETSNMLTGRTEMQSELRGAAGEMMRDLNQAGTGTPLGGIPIPSSTTGGADPQMVLTVDLISNATATYPLSGGTLYKVYPGSNLGVTTSRATDMICVTYIDPNTNWSAWPTTTVTNTSVTLPATNAAGTALTPTLGDAQYGLQVGDIILLQNSIGAAVGTVTAFNAATRVITFSADTINFNQTTPTVGNIKAIRNGGAVPSTTVARLMMVTYFIQRINGADGPDTRLMRQIGARAPEPIAEHIEDLQITYDVFDDVNQVLTTNLPDAAPGTPPVQKPNQIRKINLILTARSPRMNPSGYYDRETFATSFGPRNLSFHDRYK